MTATRFPVRIHLRKSLRALAILALPIAMTGCGGLTPPDFVGGTPQYGDSIVTPATRVPASEATFAFDPFAGAPGNTVDDLSRKIGNAASKEGLTLVRRQGVQATYRVKGHLSAVGDNTSSTIIYVFDVYDAAGRRLHRFSGQETGNAASADPWAGVEGETLDLIAERTVLALKAWLTRA